MSATQDQPTTVYSGRFHHGIDGSRRVMVPSKWREKIELSVILWPLRERQFLLVLPPTRLNLLLDKLNEMSLSDDDVAAVERVIGGNSAQIKLDKVGRLCLPEELAAEAGLRKEALFVGRLNKFEIWEPGRFKENNKGDEAVAAAAIKNLNL